jgi:hypothetical protein
LVAEIYGQTARQVIAQYPAANLTLPQTDPYRSLCTGMLYLRDCYAWLLPIFGGPLAHQQIAVADNESPGNAAKGITGLAYYYKWLPAQNSSPVSTSSRQPISVH